LGIILLGIFVVFVYNQKTLQLYRLQDNFINNFTHELKTPVTSLRLFLETLFKHELSRKDQQKYIDFMIQDVSRLSDNINRILNLARIEAKNYKGEFIRMNLVQVIEKFYNHNSHLFSNCDIVIQNPSGRSFFYPINLSFFEMLLMNLSINAVKYNDAAVPKIDVAFKPDRRHLKITFKDNGIGIEKSELKKIFRKFYQIGLSDNMSAKGSGLGLYLVQSVARIHKGKIIAESQGRGKGSVFVLILPLKY
jgi:signal transduction histidine kinase